MVSTCGLVFRVCPADTQAYYARLAGSRQSSRRAVELAQQESSHSSVAPWEGLAALRQAEFGNFGFPCRGAAEALAEKPGWMQQVIAALALARAGDRAKAAAVSQALQGDSPSKTLLRVYWLPAVQAAIQIANAEPASALAAPQEARSYDFAGALPPRGSATLYPAYLRGQAYLQAHDGMAAAAECQKSFDHRTLVLNFPLGALAHLQVGRVYALQGDVTPARAAYQDFLALRKDADLDIPVLKQAKAEYAKLQ